MDEVIDMIHAAGDLFAVLAVLAVTVTGFFLGRRWLFAHVQMTQEEKEKLREADSERH